MSSSPRVAEMVKAESDWAVVMKEKGGASVEEVAGSSA
jgi:hypothetical protein